MFSCYRATCLTLERLERPLVLTERIRRFGHFLICRHCRIHNRQISCLTILIQMKQNAGEIPVATSSENSSESGLSPEARARIAAALSSRFNSS